MILSGFGQAGVAGGASYLYHNDPHAPCEQQMISSPTLKMSNAGVTRLELYK